MNDLKLISIFKSFSKSEFKGFEKYISYPHFEGWRNMLPLFKEIKKYYPYYEDRKFTRERLFAKANSGKSYDDSRFRRQMSYLTKRAEEYLLQLAIKKRKLQTDLFLLEEYESRRLTNSFEKLSKEIKNELASEKYSLEVLYASKIVYGSRLYIHNINKLDIPMAIAFQKEIIESASSLYLYNYFNCVIAKEFMEKGFPQKLDSEVFDWMNDTFDADNYLNLKENNDISLTLPFYHFTRAISDVNNTGLYDKAKNSFMENIDKYSKSERYIYLANLASLNNLRINYSKNMELSRAAYREGFELTKLRIKYNIIIREDEDYIPIFIFKDIVHLAFILKEINWIEDFIREQIYLIEPSQRENVKSFIMAKIEYLKGNMEKSLEYFSGVEYDTFLLRIDMIQLKLFLLYELEMYETARYFIETSSKYITKAKDIHPVAKERFKDFLYFYKALLKYKDKPDKDEIMINLKKINSKNRLMSRNWLIKKFTEL
jgi:hypothetical protein